MKQPTQQGENARTLAAALGLDEERAAQLLEQPIQVTHDEGSARATLIAKHAIAMLRRTFRHVGSVQASLDGAMVELRVGRCESRSSSARQVWLGLQGGVIVVANGRISHNDDRHVHELFLLIAACYAAARTVQQAVGSGLPFGNDHPIVIDPAVLGEDIDLQKTIELGTAVLAGAGAVGNAVIYALALLPVRGVLYVVDPKSVNDGILNRCMLFESEDVGDPKAVALCRNAAPRLSLLELIARHADVATAVRELGNQFRPERMIVSVDSRRARRSLQKELPREVYDASTTGIAEVVLHFNTQPSTLACLACIYKQESREIAHEAHVAELLGVSTADVRSGYVTDVSARFICQKYSQLHPSAIKGLAYDSLFKALCAEGELKTPEDRQVLAPFAFVSALAGALLVLEMAIRLGGASSNRFNYWRVSPWYAPGLDLRQLRPALPDCEVCKNPSIVRAARLLWPRAA